MNKHVTWIIFVICASHVQVCNHFHFILLFQSRKYLLVSHVGVYALSPQKNKNLGPTIINRKNSAEFCEVQDFTPNLWVSDKSSRLQIFFGLVKTQSHSLPHPYPLSFKLFMLQMLTAASIHCLRILCAGKCNMNLDAKQNLCSVIPTAFHHFIKHGKTHIVCLQNKKYQIMACRKGPLLCIRVSFVLGGVVTLSPCCLSLKVWCTGSPSTFAWSIPTYSPISFLSFIQMCICLYQLYWYKMRWFMCYASKPVWLHFPSKYEQASSLFLCTPFIKVSILKNKHTVLLWIKYVTVCFKSSSKLKSPFPMAHSRKKFGLI